MSGLLFIFCIYGLGTSASSTQLRKSTEKCQDLIRHPKHYLQLEGEPAVLRCSYLRYQKLNSSKFHFNITWHKNDSGRTIPEKREQTRIWAEGESLWILPASLEDSGSYICTVRNSSYCVQMSIQLTVYDKANASLPFNSYKQFLFTSTSGKLVCPELRNFISKDTALEMNWYKDSVLLDKNSENFTVMKGSPFLLIKHISLGDSGYYICEMIFTHEGKKYNITRRIELQVIEKKKDTVPVIVYPNQETILTALGSKLIIPCKVFLGLGEQSSTWLRWTSNNSLVTNVYKEGRVSEGERLEFSENNENYIEVPLIFDPVIKEDMYTDFKCLAHNTVGSQMLLAKVGEAPTFSWWIAMAPVLLIFFVLGCIWMHRCWKQRAGKAYVLTHSEMLRNEDEPSTP
ncbi:interleukin-1 receptor type 2 [Tachyglossus aculeatus]|uniref:interleukin-1 receptor type 2 n=1 Tax=Tachyglossus aculeatus TaxID=9261 RepID=UPI0018F4D38A|nr:interleukin-1 receptor type 2 [Tachyglossus aculeatus]